MQQSLQHSIDILKRTPDLLIAQLQELLPEWTTPNEGGDSWSVYDIVGHLIHGEKTDWVTRAKIILSTSTDKSFEVFDRFAQFENSRGKTLDELLNEFKALRENNIRWVLTNVKQEDFSRTGIHPAFGKITLSQLIATWAVHDLNHIAQIARVMAVQYKEAVGPWIPYLRILQW